MARIFVRLTPGSARESIEGWDEDGQGRRYLKVRVRAAPIEGRANAALLALLADALGVARSRLTLARGDTARLKAIDIEGVGEEDISRLVG